MKAPSGTNEEARLREFSCILLLLDPLTLLFFFFFPFVHHRIDVTETQLLLIAIQWVTAVMGQGIWSLQLFSGVALNEALMYGW